MVNGFNFQKNFKVWGKGFDHIWIAVANYNLWKIIMLDSKFHLSNIKPPKYDKQFSF